jgi:hypothetical protein
MKREIRPEEMSVIYQLAAEYSDLHTIPVLIAELQRRVDDLTSLAMGAASVQPKSIDDLLKLRAAKLVTDDWIKQRLGIESAPEIPPSRDDASLDRLYVVHDKRAATA